MAVLHRFYCKVADGKTSNITGFLFGLFGPIGLGILSALCIYVFYIYDMQIDSKRGAGRPKQTWKKLTEKDCHEWKLTTVDPQERSTWRSGVRSAMRAASQLSGKGPTDVDDAPAPAR